MKRKPASFLRIPGLLVLLFLPAVSQAQDAVASLPQQWQSKLTPIPANDLSGASTFARHSIRSVRDKLSSMLVTTETTQANDISSGYGELAALYHLNAMPALAKIGYQNALKLDPYSFRWRYYSAWLAAETGDLNSAVTQYQQALHLKPGYAPITLRLAIVLIELDQIEKAKQLLLSIEKDRSVKASANFHLGQIALLERRFEDAIKRFQATLQINPDASAAHFPLVRALRATGKDEEAKIHIENVGDDLPVIDDPIIKALNSFNLNAHPIFKQGISAAGARDYVAAKEYFKRGLEIDSENLNAKISYARLLYMSGDKQLAEEVFKQVSDSNPQHANASFFLALIVNQKSGDDPAELLFKKALNANPDHSGALFYLANLLYRQARFEEAMKFYKRAIELDSELLPAKFYILLCRYLSADASATEIIEKLDRLIGDRKKPSIMSYTRDMLVAGKYPAEIHNNPYLQPAIPNPLFPIRDYPSPRAY